MSHSKKNIRVLYRYVDFIRMRTNDAMNAFEQDFPFKLSSSNYHIHIVSMKRTAIEPNSKRIQFEATNFRLDSLLHFSIATWP